METQHINKYITNSAALQVFAAHVWLYAVFLEPPVLSIA